MAEFVWLIVAVVLFVVEALTYGLVSIWFALGAVVTMIAVFCGVEDVVWQLVIFLVSSAVFLLFTRKFFKKYLYHKAEKTNVDSLIGQQAVVTEEIDNIHGKGAVKIDGKIWTARTKEREVVAAGRRVTVLEIQGVKLIVEDNSIRQDVDL